MDFLRTVDDISLPAEKQAQWTTRTRRIIFLLVFIWVINLFDLAFTLTMVGTEEFVEMNPFARMLLMHSPTTLMVFKISVLVMASTVFMIFRRHWLTEAGCWILSGAYAGVAFLWVEYSRLLQMPY